MELICYNIAYVLALALQFSAGGLLVGNTNTSRKGSKDFGTMLINVLKIDKYNLPELNDNDIDRILIDYHNSAIERID